MPPVMGAVAFIMSETINVPYVDICVAATIPAMLYFFTAFLMVHLEAGRAGLHGIPKEDCPNPWSALREGWYLVLPLMMLVFLLFSGYTPLFSGMVALALTVVLIFGLRARRAVRPDRHPHPVLDPPRPRLRRRSSSSASRPSWPSIAVLASALLLISGGRKRCATPSTPWRTEPATPCRSASPAPRSESSSAC